MNDTKRREIAKDFISKHKENDIENWTAWLSGRKDPLLQIYYSLLEESTCTNIEENGIPEFYCEIGRHESKSGNPIIFEFEDDSYSK